MPHGGSRTNTFRCYKRFGPIKHTTNTSCLHLIKNLKEIFLQKFMKFEKKYKKTNYNVIVIYKWRQRLKKNVLTTDAQWSEIPKKGD